LKDVTQACQHICSDAVRQHITISHDTTPTHKQEDNSSLTPLIGTTAVASHDEPSTTVPQCCDSNPANEEQNQQLNSSVSHKLEDKASRTPSGCTIVSQGEPSTTVPPCCNSTSVNKEQNHQLSDSMTQSASAPPTVASQPPTQPLTGEFIALDSTADATLPTPPPPGPSHKIKRRRSSRRSKRKSLKEPEVAGSTNVLGGIYPLSQQSQMSSDQVQSEIQAIDSILKALNTGGYSMSSMDTLPQLTGGTNNTLQMAPTSVTKDVDGAKVHQAVKAASSVSSVQSYGSSRLDSSSSDSGSSTDSSDESVNIGVSGEGRWQGDGEEGEVNRDRRDYQFSPKTKGETSYKELPTVEQCNIAFPENGRLLPIATVSHYTEQLCT
jgi:hypothetical protein